MLLYWWKSVSTNNCAWHIEWNCHVLLRAGDAHFILHTWVVLHVDAIISHLIWIHEGVIQFLSHPQGFISYNDKYFAGVYTSPRCYSDNFWNLFCQLVLITVRWHLSLRACIGEDNAVTTKDGCISVWVQLYPPMVWIITIAIWTGCWEAPCWHHLVWNNVN